MSGRCRIEDSSTKKEYDRINIANSSETEIDDIVKPNVLETELMRKVDRQTDRLQDYRAGNMSP